MMTNTEPTRRRVEVWITPGAGEWGAQLPENQLFLSTAPTREQLLANLPDALERFLGEPVDFRDMGPAP